MTPERSESSERATKASLTPADSSLGGARHHMPAEARRAQILEAALSCFGDRGYHATTMDDLVAASGLSKGSLYWHFRSKEEVFLALFDSFGTILYGEWDAAAASGGDAIEILRREFSLSVEIFSTERVILSAWVEFLSHPAARERMRSAYSTARQKLASIIDAGRAAGTLRPGPPAEQVAGALVGAIEGLFLQWLVDPEFALKAHVDVAWEILMGGLRK